MTNRDETIPTSGGVPVTKDQIDRLVAEAEHGYDIDTCAAEAAAAPRARLPPTLSRSVSIRNCVPPWPTLPRPITPPDAGRAWPVRPGHGSRSARRPAGRAEIAELAVRRTPLVAIANGTARSCRSTLHRRRGGRPAGCRPDPAGAAGRRHGRHGQSAADHHAMEPSQRTTIRSCRTAIDAVHRYSSWRDHHRAGWRRHRRRRT